MKSKKRTDNTATVLGKGMRIDAKLLSGKGTVRIEGEYYGDINIEGELVLEKSGHITGNASADMAYISGSVAGDIKCTDLLHIKTTGRIRGDIECDAVLMDEGAVFIGYSKMREQPQEPDPLGIMED